MSRAEILLQYASITSLRAEDRDNPPCALSPREQAELQRFRHPGRREAWLWGRVLAKRLIRESLGTTGVRDDEIEILSRDGGGRGMRPLIRIRTERRRWQLSISHSETGVAAAFCRDGVTGLGIDLVKYDSAAISDSFLRTWFTADERRLLQSRKSPSARYEFWAAKEATFKACQRGERFAPRRIRILEHHGNVFDVQFQGNRHPQNCRVVVRRIDAHIFALATVGDESVGNDKTNIEQPLSWISDNTLPLSRPGRLDSTH